MPPNASSADVRKSTTDVLVGALIRIGLDPSEIDMKFSLEELDVNSLDIVEIMEIIREELDIELQGQDVLACITVQDVADLLSREASAVRS
jgi:acyl carrier protein